MKNPIFSLVLATMIVAPLAAFADEGPRASSLDNWPGMTNATASASVPAVSPFEGPRPSEMGNWAGMTGNTIPPNVSSADPVFEGPRPSSNH